MAEKRKILIIDTSANAVKPLARGLIKSGFKAKSAQSELTAAKLVKNESFDLVIADPKTPYIDRVIKAAAEGSKKTASEPKNVLIVEDERAIAQAIEAKLKKSGFKTKHAEDGLEALNILKKTAFDIVLLDLMLPVIDGFKVLETLREREFITPVFVFTNLTEPASQDRAKKLGASEYFVKSNTSLAEVVERINKTVNGRSK